MPTIETNWSNFVYEFEGGFYERGSQRFVYCFDDVRHENLFKLWVNWLIEDEEPIDFELLLDTARFIENEKGSYKAFRGKLGIGDL